VPVLSRLRDLVDDYRAAKTGVALLGGVGAALSPLSAIAQDKPTGSVQTAQVQAGTPVAKANFVKPPMPLEPHCSDIKLVFDAVKFDGPYRTLANAWVASGCKGDVPIPEPGENMKRFNASVQILHNGAKVSLTP
jgi:hypothetical protein